MSASRICKVLALLISLALGWWTGAGLEAVLGDATSAPTSESARDWNQWGGKPDRNNTPQGAGICTEWNIGRFDYRTGAWDSSKAKNIKWVARLGSETYGNAVVSGGKVFIGTNNGGGWLPRYPKDVDLGCLLAFDIEKGDFLWQHSSEKLPDGDIDWPDQGVCNSAYVEGDRLWYVTNRGDICCLDTEGFRDGENDGEVTDEEARIQATGKPYDLKQEADVVWTFDMMKELGVLQHNMASCSITAAGDLLFVCTSNGVDADHTGVPAPEAPSFLAIHKNTHEIAWTDASPGANILHGQWSSPAYGVLGGVPQVIFGGGDGWVYSFAPEGDGQGHAQLLWKFDANPKTSRYALKASDRSYFVATPVIYNALVYIAVGEEPEPSHGEGVGHLWCIDPTKRGDVSPTLAYNKADPQTPIPPKRLQAIVPNEGDFEQPNPNSAAVWHYSGVDLDEDGKVAFEETMHRTISTVVIKDDLLYIADFIGIFHCLDAKTGQSHWTCDMLASVWGSPLIVEDKVYLGDEDGELAVFRHSADPEEALADGEPFYGTQNMANSVYSTPIVADNVLYISNRTHLFAITTEGH
jgi:outer membrane protein assembly factor BamB